MSIRLFLQKNNDYNFLNTFDLDIFNQLRFFNFIFELKESFPNIHSQTLSLFALSSLSSYFQYKHRVSMLQSGDESIPIGIFFMGEKPSGTGKSLLMDTFLIPLIEHIEEFNKEKNNKILLFPHLESTIPSIQNELNETKKCIFSIFSDEKSGINSLFVEGSVRGDHAFLMRSFDGRYHRSERVSRGLEMRRNWCSICFFTQKDTIKNFATKVDEDGFLFRFLLSPLSDEKDNQDFNLNLNPSQRLENLSQIKLNLKTQLKNLFENINFEFLNNDVKNFWHSLEILIPDQEGADFLNKQSIFFETKYCEFESQNSYIASFYGKGILHVLKIAANLFCYEKYFCHVKEFQNSNIIPIKILKIAFEFFKVNAEIFEKLFFDPMSDENLIHLSDEEEEIVKYFQKYKLPSNLEILKSKLRHRKIFQNKTKNIEIAINALWMRHILETDDSNKYYFNHEQFSLISKQVL